MKKVIITIVLTILVLQLNAEKKNILLDISHENDTAYTKVNPYIFEEYNDLIVNKVDANLIINKNKELNDSILSNIDLLIIPSPLDRDRKTSKNNLTQVEKQSIIDFINRGGKLIIFMDEDERVDMEAFGANDIVKPFGLAFGSDLPMVIDIAATSLPSEISQEKHELAYSGSRSISGGTPISIRNGEGNHTHGTYVEMANAGTVVAFGETMTGLFMGGVRMKLKDGNYIVWKGKDDKIFMQKLIEWLLKQ